MGLDAGVYRLLYLMKYLMSDTGNNVGTPFAHILLAIGAIVSATILLVLKRRANLRAAAEDAEAARARAEVELLALYDEDKGASSSQRKKSNNQSRNRKDTLQVVSLLPIIILIHVLAERKSSKCEGGNFTKPEAS